MKLTVAYVTSRKEPHFEWFWESLWKQAQAELEDHTVELVVVDFHHDTRQKPLEELFISARSKVRFVAPKPTVWQGPHRLTKEDWFAPSNARNTALCLAPDGWIVYVDDLSVLMPGWLNAVKQAMAGNYIVMGAYKKVKKLVVDKGDVVSYEETLAGIDTRWRSGRDDEPVPAGGEWMYGCSVAMPVEALCAIGGWPEICDGLGSEDYCCGIVLKNSGYTFKYDRRMLTLESEEHHHLEPAMKRSDYGVSPQDKSHAVLNICMDPKMTFFDNYIEGGMCELRKKILAGEPFPVLGNPQHEWFSGKSLGDL